MLCAESCSGDVGVNSSLVTAEPLFVFTVEERQWLGRLNTQQEAVLSSYASPQVQQFLLLSTI